ncbi:radical SAM protein [Oxalobacter formigenes]
MIATKTIPVKNWITPSKLPGVDVVINPYVGCPHKCVYCYAGFMKTFTNHEEDWGDFLDVKHCDKPVSTKQLAGKNVVISSVTDPYNAFEKQYRVTRHLLEQLQECRANITIITKSDLILRDIDLISQLENVEVALSVNSFDDTFRRHFEPRAPTSKRRIDALRQLHVAGIKTVLFMSPIFPGITDFREIVKATRAWVDTYWFENLNLKNTARNQVARAIGQHYPGLIPLYRTIYRDGDKTYWYRLIDEIENYCTEKDIPFRNVFHP